MGPTHQYKRRELSVLLTQGDDDDSEFDDTPHQIEEPTNQTEISLNSVMGFSNPKTLKLQDSINCSPVVVMVDSGGHTQFYILLFDKTATDPSHLHEKLLPFGIMEKRPWRGRGRGKGKGKG